MKLKEFKKAVSGVINFDYIEEYFVVNYDKLTIMDKDATYSIIENFNRSSFEIDDIDYVLFTTNTGEILILDEAYELPF